LGGAGDLLIWINARLERPVGVRLGISEMTGALLLCSYTRLGNGVKWLGTEEVARVGDDRPFASQNGLASKLELTSGAVN
jgi:hypothetical protein